MMDDARPKSGLGSIPPWHAVGVERRDDFLQGSRNFALAASQGVSSLPDLRPLELSLTQMLNINPKLAACVPHRLIV